MTRPVLLATVGLPGSGKTTAADRITRRPGWWAVSRDDVRIDLGCHPIGTAEEEADVTDVQAHRIVRHLRRGRSVVVHDTNVRAVMPDGSGSPLDRLRSLAAEHGADFRVLDLRHVDVEECIRRQAGRPERERVPEDIIRAMAEQAAAMPPIPEHELWGEPVNDWERRVMLHLNPVRITVWAEEGAQAAAARLVEYGLLRRMPNNPTMFEYTAAGHDWAVNARRRED